MVQRMDQRIALIAIAQHGVFSRNQARDLAFTPAQISHRLKVGRWIEITPRVYRMAGAPDTERARLMSVVLSGGIGGVATAESALGLRGLRGFSVLPAKVAIARRPHRLALPGVFETFRLPEPHQVLVDGIPTATVARALFDLARTRPERPLARAVDVALAARLVRIAEIETVIADLAERGRKGAPVLRRIVDERRGAYQPATSELEARFLELIRDRGLPEPECQVELSGRLGWIGKVDNLWREPRVVVETDGGQFHESVTDRENDERRDQALELEGYTVYRFSWIDIVHRPTSVVNLLRRALNPAA